MIEKHKRELFNLQLMYEYLLNIIKDCCTCYPVPILISHIENWFYSSSSKLVSIQIHTI